MARMNAWSNSDCRERTPRRAGFTLVELLAVMAVIVLLAALALPALAGSKGRTKIGQCASNLKQYVLALQIYGNENLDQLPVLGTGSWVWDMPWTVATDISRYGATRQVVYCPGTAPRFIDADNLNLYNYAPQNYRLLGYVAALSGSPSLIATNVNRTLTPQSYSVGPTLLPPPVPSQRVLVADATLSAPGQNNEALRLTYNYTAIQSGYSKPHLSPHLTGRIPVGGNLGMLDGHVEWRGFADMHVRTQGATPAFWW